MVNNHKTVLCCFLIVLCSPLAVAQTPDGVTPANERVCDDLMADSVTPGLYGLCVAYCEAQDCDDLSVGPEELSAQCRAPSPRILENYNKRKAPTDPDMPCVQEPCPCWSTTEIAAIGTTYPQNTVEFSANDNEGFSNRALLEDRVGSPGAYQVAAVRSYPLVDSIECAYFNFDFASTPPDPAILRVQEISAEQADICEAHVYDQWDALLDRGVFVPCVGNACGP